MYEYSQENILENPYHYMYTPFEGKGFLDNFFSFRERCMENIYENIGLEREADLEVPAIVNWCLPFIKDEVCKGKLEDFLDLFQKKKDLEIFENSAAKLKQAKVWLKELCNRNEAYTVEIFKNLIVVTILGDEEDLANIHFLLNAFLKKYEIFKRIFTMYDGRSLRKIGNDYRSLPCYMYLSLTFGLYSSKWKNLKFLNTLLKINDLICSNLSEFKDRLERLLFYATLILERNLLKSLIIEKGL